MQNEHSPFHPFKDLDELLEELHVSGRTPDEICRAHPELLPQVQAGWQRLRALEAEVDALFPTSVNDAGPRPLSTNDLPQIHGYEVQGVLGHGGMGVVYKAWHQRLNRVVALKMLIAGAHASPEESERFLREAEAVAGLRHANIVQVHDIGDLDGLPYFTMEFVEGGSLFQKLAGTPQPARAAATLVATLAEAVQSAHQKGIVHRDLKPANILLTADGAPKITDFGLARRFEEGGGLTLSGVPMGTPSYMAPEQAQGLRNAIGPATDIYALGGILYEMLTGRPPFRAETAAATIQQLLSQEPVPPSRLNAQVPRDLETICLKCVQKDPKKRYATAGELAADLERFLKHQPILARPIGPIERCLRWTQRHVGLTAALCGIGFLLVSLVVGSLLAAVHFRKMEHEQRDLATAKGLLAEEKEKEREKAVQAERSEAALRQKAEQGERREAALHQQTRKQGHELLQSLYFAEMNLGGQAALLPSGIGRVRDWLTPWENNRPDRPDMRDWEWYYLKGLCHRDLMTLQGHVNRVWAVAWSKDGRLASAGSDGTIRLWDTTVGQEVGCIRHNPNVWSLAWSPDEKRLVSAGGDGTVKVWDAATGEELVTFRGHSGDVFSVAWGPDGNRLASGGADKTIQIWGAADGKVVHVFRGHVEAVSSVAWSVDGKTLASAGRDHAVRLWDAAAWKDGPVLSGHVNWVNSVAWSSLPGEGARLASAGNDLTVKVWDPAAAKVLATLRGHTQGVKSVAWSPDGLRLVTSSEDQTVKIWQADAQKSGSWESTCTLRGHTAMSSSAAWSFDGKRLASGSDDATVKVWDATCVPETRLLRGHADPFVSLAWHKDSQRLASAMDGTIKIWDMREGKEQAVLRGHKGRVLSTAWSPDGKWLASAGSDQVIRLWATAHNLETNSLHGHTEEIRSVAWSPDGRRLASAGTDKTVRIWDVQTGEQVQICRGHDMRVWSVAWSPDGKRLASASADRTVRMWNATNGHEDLVLRVHEGEVTSVAWSPDGRWLASAGYDHTIKVSDADTGKRTITLQGHTARVNALAWNPESTRLASTGEDWTIKIWDAATGKVTLTLGDHAGGVYALAWSPDGCVLASAGDDRTIVIHDAEAGYRAVRSPRYLATLDQRLAVNAMNPADWQVRAEIHARLGDWDKAAADLQRYLKLQPNKRWHTLDCWVVGPYPEDLKTSYPPDKILNPAAPIAGPGHGDAPALLHWKSVPLNAQGFVDFGPLFGNAEHISAYALLRVYSPRRQPVAILVGSDDYVRLSLNGKLIHEYLQSRAAKADEDAIAATLEPGWNTLLARVVNVTGAHALYWRLSDEPADLLRAQKKSRR